MRNVHGSTKNNLPPEARPASQFCRELVRFAPSTRASATLQAMATPSQLKRDFDVGQRLCDAPLVHTVDGVLSADLCRHIVAIAKPKMSRAQVSGQAGLRVSHGRSNSRTWVRHDTDELVYDAVSKVAAIVGLPLVYAESLQVIHYGTGQEYRPHFDAYDLATEKGQRYCQRAGQRLITALVYLTDVEAGGATGFPNLGFEVAPRCGKLLIFHNCFPGTTIRDPKTYHQGKPPTRGGKWAFNLWFHERRYQSP